MLCHAVTKIIVRLIIYSPLFEYEMWKWYYPAKLLRLLSWILISNHCGRHSWVIRRMYLNIAQTMDGLKMFFKCSSFIKSLILSQSIIIFIFKLLRNECTYTNWHFKTHQDTIVFNQPCKNITRRILQIVNTILG